MQRSEEIIIIEMMEINAFIEGYFVALWVTFCMTSYQYSFYRHFDLAYNGI